ncbi:hypothetical protein [Paraburkholderia oxyphila]|uniref:hypothetical protein n=1 Tax=Paraburkholderia oxyphila TaxID=614212 RepID=UPI0012EE8A19|nr:hypothetical protein [Paraburkholderia oxyphila]
MAEQDTLLRRPAASPEDIAAVAARLEDLFHSVAAMHELCCENMCNPDTASTFVLMRDLLRSAARDLEVCTALAGTQIPPGMGTSNSPTR